MMSSQSRLLGGKKRQLGIGVAKEELETGRKSIDGGRDTNGWRNWKNMEWDAPYFSVKVRLSSQVTMGRLRRSL